MDTFFKRLEGKIFDPNYLDTGLQIKLLLKTDWPEVRTKQDLIEENMPCIVYDGKQTDNIEEEEKQAQSYIKSVINQSESTPEESIQKEIPKVNKRTKKMKKKMEEESEESEVIPSYQTKPTETEHKNQSKNEDSKPSKKKSQSKERELKMQRILGKLLVISGMSKQRSSAVRYIHSIQEKMQRKGYFKGYEDKLKELITQITTNSNLDHEIQDVAKDILDTI